MYQSSGQSDHGFVNPGYAVSHEVVAASAPPSNVFDNVPGYEGTLAGGGGGFLPPPMIPPYDPSHQPEPSQPQWNIPAITEEAARDAFKLYASSKCCYSSAPAKNGVITNMEAFNTYRYRLETFTESRSTEWSQKPYNGEPVDAFTQQPPGPWDIPAQAPTFFKDSKQVIKVPYTSSMKNCTDCLAMGRMPCKNCSGAGNKVCWVCNGSGYRHGEDRCHHCSGRGRENCTQCQGQGSKECSTCKGKRQLLAFINLSVKWTNNISDYIVEQSSGLLLENLNQVTGKELFKDARYMVRPVIGFPDLNVANAAERLIREHQATYTQTSRVLQQQQTIELIPITKVTYQWKGNSHIYFVYGNEFRVNADNYPATCCCTIM